MGVIQGTLYIGACQGHSMEVEEDHVYTRVDPSEVPSIIHATLRLPIPEREGTSIVCGTMSHNIVFSRQVLRSYSTLSMHRTQCAGI